MRNLSKGSLLPLPRATSQVPHHSQGQGNDAMDRRMDDAIREKKMQEFCWQRISCNYLLVRPGILTVFSTHNLSFIVAQAEDTKHYPREPFDCRGIWTIPFRSQKKEVPPLQSKPPISHLCLPRRNARTRIAQENVLRWRSDIAHAHGPCERTDG